MKLADEVVCRPGYEDGVHVITNDEYHASAGISRSALWKFKITPYHYWYEYLRKPYEPSAATPSKNLGEAVHVSLLEPELFDQKIAIEPDVNKRTNAGKEKIAEFLAKNKGKTILTKDQGEEYPKIGASLKSNDTFKALLDGAKIERSIYFTHERTGIQCKVRPDIWLNAIVGDLKTTADASYRAFQSSAYKYGYYLQAGMMHAALRSLNIKMEKFVIPCVETSEPYIDAIYVLDQAAIDYGVCLFNRLMDEYMECLDKDEWPGYGIQTMTIPNYANYED